MKKLFYFLFNNLSNKLENVLYSWGISLKHPRLSKCAALASSLNLIAETL